MKTSIDTNILPKYRNNNIAITLAASAYYAPYMAVTILSVIQKASADKNYDILVVNKEISEEDREKILSMVDGHANISIRFFNVSAQYANLNYNYREGYAPESFFRVLLPYFLPDYDKILYLDCDIITLRDVAELYETNLEGYLTAAAHDPDCIHCYYENFHNRRLYMDAVLKLNSPVDYFQSGVMLINLKEIRSTYTLEELLTVSCNPDIIWGDQDVLNIICKNKVKYLPMNWNTIVDGYGGRVRDVEEWAPKEISNAYIAAKQNPYIVHYAGVQPWKNPKVDMNQYFWPVMQKCPFKDVIKERIKENLHQEEEKSFNVCGYPFIYSVIIPVYNAEEYLEETIESILTQTIGFEKNIQLILVNNATEDNSEEICLKYRTCYPDNIMYIKLEKNVGPIGGRKAGLPYATGKYINFLDADDKWREDAYEKAFTYFENHFFEMDLLACRIWRFGAFEKWDINDGKFSYSRVINVAAEYDELLQSMCSTIFKAAFVKSLPWNYEIVQAEDGIFLTSAILKRMSYGVCREAVFCYRKRETPCSWMDTRTENKAWYLETTEHGYFKLVDECLENYYTVPLYAQSLFIEELVDRLRKPVSEILTDKEREKYISLIRQLVLYIDDYVIWNKQRLTKEEKMYLCHLKYGEKLKDKILITKNTVYFNNITCYQFNWGSSLMIEIIDFQEEQIRFRGKVNIPLPYENYFIYAQSDRGKKFDITMTDTICDSDKHIYLGEEFLSPKYFDVTIPLKYVNKIKFYINVQNQIYVLGYYMECFSRCCSKEYANSYCANRSYILKPYGLEILILKNTPLLHLKKEIRFCQELFYKNKYKVLVWRMLVHLCRSLRIYNNVWLVTDRKFAADDSGESFFAFLSTIRKKKFQPYFVISKQSPDYKRMKKYGKVVDTDSFKHKLLFLLSDKIVSALTNDWVFNTMHYYQHELYDLLRFDFIHIQHGIVKDDISSDIGLMKKNIKLFVTSAKREYDSMLEYPYGYSEENICLTGLPRFDMIYDCIEAKKEKTILIAPTWRKYLRGPYNGEKDTFGYNSEFKNSEYYEFYNTLINDDRLITTAKRNGYNIKLRLHPVMDGQIIDFEKNDSVEFCDVKANYHAEMQETALLVTDFSSIAFDFAYVKTPVVYAQFDRETFYSGHTYREGYFHYETDAFGPVCSDYETTLQAIIQYIETGCQMEEIYLKRRQKFYQYFDNRNCERIYQKILKLEQ